MNIEEIREFALSLPHVTEDMPFGPDVLALRIGGNMGGKTKRAMLSERSEVGSRDVSVSYGAMS